MTTALRALERTKVKPILFSGPMVRALLEDRKTQTRRVLKNQDTWNRIETIVKRFPEQRAEVPYAPGDLLWVRETMYRDFMENMLTGERTTKAAVAYYSADDGEAVERAGFNLAWVWKRKTLPAIHMPRWASRLTLEVTSVKVERLQEISIEDARAEGVATEEWEDWRENAQSIALPEGSRIEDERDLFRNLWNSLHGADACWDVNPWVCAISFIVHQMNVDAFLAQREAA